MLFTYDRVSLCILIVSGIWTCSRLLNREMHYHCAITEPTAMCWLCCWIKFCSTQYNTPRTFGLASYSVVFCDLCRVSAFAYLHWPLKLHTSPWVQPLGQIHYPFSYQLTGLVLLWGQHHLLLSNDLRFLSALESLILSTTSSVIVTTTGLISDRYLAVVSRLA